MLKLKKLEIGKNNQDGYKNLQNFKLDFSNSNGLTILIGNNGSGKSNVLEAISLIFYKLYIDDIENIGFKFLIEYEKDEFNFRIHNIRNDVKFYKNNNLITKEEFYRNLSDNIPDKIFTLYSGEELRLWEECYFQSYTDYYKKVIQKQLELNSLKMNYINKYFWNIAILILFLKDKIKIQNIIGNIEIDQIKFEINTINLNKYHRDTPNTITRAINAIKNTLHNNGISLQDFRNIQYKNEYDEDVGLSEIYEDLYYIFLASLLPKDEDYKTLNKLEIIFNNGLEIKSFSEGQKKEILVTFIAEVLASQYSIFLLDEPDSHIHPIRKKNIIEILKQSDTKNIIMTTHSPTLIKDVDAKHLVLIKNGEIVTSDKIEALREVTDGKWAIDSINNVLIAQKDILLVEGKTDIEYIETALQKLREYKRDEQKYRNLDFIILPFGGSSGLVNFIDKFNTSNNQIIIALLDKDNAGKESFCKVFPTKNVNNLTDDDFNNIHEKNGIKIVFLPTINNESIFEIEDYFTIDKLKKFGKKLYNRESFKQLKDFFNIKEQIKKELPNACKNFDKKDFRNFRKLFDLILQIKENNNGNA